MNSKSVVVVHTGLGNIASILNMLRKLRVEAVASADVSILRSATRIILPGVGAFDAGMERLKNLGLVDSLKEAALERRVPLLGVCLGMQLLCDGSDEGDAPGLGLIPGRAIRIPVPPSEAMKCKLPHMGWNEVHIKARQKLFEGEMPDPRFYFVHSYHVVTEYPDEISATTTHGSTRVTASIGRSNILGVQFHPEKSHRYGMWLMNNFVNIPPC